MDYRKWAYKHPNWLSNERRRTLESIMTVSLFNSKNSKTKLSTTFSKLAYNLYHPIAKFRFNKRFFFAPYEILLANRLLF